MTHREARGGEGAEGAYPSAKALSPFEPLVCHILEKKGPELGAEGAEHEQLQEVGRHCPRGILLHIAAK